MMPDETTYSKQRGYRYWLFDRVAAPCTHRRFQLGQLALQIASYASQDRALASQHLAHALELARMR
ncbi:hypothetical protein BXO8_13495, partial [Xanthomonas oryzae pv. oryzae]